MLSPDEEAHIDRVCDQFESELRNSSPIRLMDFLQQVPKELQEPLLAELCGIVAEIRGNEAVEELAVTFRREFPDLGDQFQSAFDHYIFATQAHIRNPTSLPSSPTITDSKIIDCYRLVEQIGEGGMGTVWLAEQTQPVRRRVALKIIKPGLNSREVIARFEAERQALALMDHPNIARILDAGTTEQGQPYFAMEWVKGTPLTEYSDKHRLNLEQRLGLFIRVCDAVQHAHQKGIIHRDLKPGNILVTEYDGQPVPKVIDFGLAKALDATHQLTDKSLFTEFGQVLGTLKYMSPEQAGLDSLDVDTRSDIYTLGVILYELLTGSTPLDNETVKGHALLKVLELIREQESPRPSSRLATSKKEAIEVVTAKRRTDAKHLGTVLSGDLDWIVMKSLEKNRNRRYESANGLSQDLHHFLNQEPVTARPPSFGYKANKFIRKHRGWVASAAALVSLLILGIAGTSYGLYKANANAKSARLASQRADREADKALKLADTASAARDEATAAKQKAEQRAKDLEVVTQFQAAQLSGIDLREMGESLRNSILQAVESDSQGELQPLLEAINFSSISLNLLKEHILDSALNTLEEGYQDQPFTKSYLLDSLGVVMMRLGLHEQALGPLTTALEIRREQLGNDSIFTLTSANNLAYLMRLRGEVNAAANLYEEAITISRRVLGEGHPETIRTINNFGRLLLVQRKLTEAEPVINEAWELSQQHSPPDDENRMLAANNLGSLYEYQGKIDSAETYLRLFMEMAERARGPESNEAITAKANLSNTLAAQGKFGEAKGYMLDVLQSDRLQFGDHHANTLNSLVSYGTLCLKDNNMPAAREALTEAIAGCRAHLEQNNPVTLQAMNAMGKYYAVSKQYEEASKQFRDSLDLAKSVYGEESLRAATAMSGLASAFLELGQIEEADSMLTDALQIVEREMPGPSLLHFSILESLGRVRLNQQNYAEAKRLFQAADEMIVGGIPVDPQTQQTLKRNLETAQQRE